MKLHIIILAAGKGMRMHSKLPKVMHKLGGKPLLEHVINTAKSLRPQKIYVVHGEDGDLLQKHFSKNNIIWIKQNKILGTGHAVMQALPQIEHSSRVLILYGDVPLITSETLKHLIKNTPIEGLGVISAEFSDPGGFGRIVRNNRGDITAIVEHKDATKLQQQIKEINTGILVTTSKILRNYLPRLHKNNAQNEYYLTDIIAMLHNDNIPICCSLTSDPEEVLGVNDQKQLAHIERRYQKKLADTLMSRGLILMDPNRFDIRGDLIVGNNVMIDINVVVEGKVIIGSDTTIGPNNFLKNTVVGENVTIRANCVIEDAVIADNCIIGPFARVRPKTFLSQNVNVGNFVEIKNTKIGKNSKANHLSYLGDSIIGNDVNIGAGSITCNYDGVTKHQTIIKNGVFVGSNTSLVAPVTLGENTIVGAGSVITEDTPRDKLTLGRARQVTIEDWKRKKKSSPIKKSRKK